MSQQEEIEALVKKVANLDERLEATEGLLVLMSQDVRILCRVFNGVIDQMMVPGFNKTMAKDELRAIWERWRSLNREETELAGTPPAGQA